MTGYPIISIIVPNWNGKQYLKKCLSSLLKQDYSGIEIILVDNGSSDGSVEFVEQNYPDIVIVSHKTNLGFAQGINSGIKVSRGKYLATLNNDTEADSEWISRLVRVMESDSEIGCCASKMLRYYDRDIIDSAGVILYQNGNAYDRGANERDTGQYESQVEVFGACAGAALYRRRMLEDIGLFDGDYFAYLEDVDLSFRMHIFGWKCIFVPDAIVYHIHSATSKQASPFKLYHLERNKLWNMWKYYPLQLFIGQIPYTNIFYLKYFLLFVNKLIGKDSHENDCRENDEPVLNYNFISIVSAVLRAKLSAYSKLPDMLLQRRKLRLKGADLSKIDRWIIKGYKK